MDMCHVLEFVLMLCSFPMRTTIINIAKLYCALHNQIVCDLFLIFYTITSQSFKHKYPLSFHTAVIYHQIKSFVSESPQCLDLSRMIGLCEVVKFSVQFSSSQSSCDTLAHLVPLQRQVVTIWHGSLWPKLNKIYKHLTAPKHFASQREGSNTCCIRIVNTFLLFV